MCAVIISLSGCSKGEEKQEQKEKEVVTTVLEKLYTIPDQKLQDAYEEATKMAEQAAAETTEPGAYGVYDFQRLMEEMYGLYFTEEGITSIPSFEKFIFILRPPSLYRFRQILFP